MLITLLIIGGMCLIYYTYRASYRPDVLTSLAKDETNEGVVLQYGTHRCKICPGENPQMFVKYFDKMDKKQEFLNQLKEANYLHDFDCYSQCCRNCDLDRATYMYLAHSTPYELICKRHHDCDKVLATYDSILD